MKCLTTIFLILICLISKATNYYVSNAGSDANAGTSTATSWATTSKVNGFSFTPGDSILFKGGDTWNSQLKPISSNIYVGSYGTGKATFTGFRTATGWTDSSGIWYTTLTGSVPYQNTIMIDGVMRAKGRYPNTTTLLCITRSFTTVELDNSVIPSFSLVGAEFVIQEQSWIWDVGKVIAQTSLLPSDTITLQDPLSYNSNFVFGNRYFIQNSIKTLDLNYEWAYDSLTKKIWVKLDHEPNLQYSSIDTLISNHNISNVTYDGIAITGGNKIGFSADTNRNITFKNSTINYSGKNGIQLNNSPQTIIRNVSISDSWNDGSYTRQQSDTTLFDSVYIYNSGTVPGMNFSGNSAMCGIFTYGLKQTLTNSVIRNTGYHGFYWLGVNALVQYNRIDSACLITEDGAGVYTVSAIGTKGSRVVNNIISNSQGTYHVSASAGVYLDGSADSVYVANNTIWGCNVDAIVCSGTGNASGHIIRNNTVVATFGRCFAMLSNGSYSRNNIFYKASGGASTLLPYKTPVQNLIGSPSAGFMDSNYVIRQNSTDSVFFVPNTYYTLAAWTALNGLEAHSHQAPTGITSAAPVLYYNATKSTVSASFGGLYKDATGAEYNNSKSLGAFGSALLFKADHELPTSGGSIGNLIFN